MKMDIIKDPMMIYQEMKMEMSGQEAQNVKQYITSDAIYSQVGEQWVKILMIKRSSLLSKCNQA